MLYTIPSLETETPGFLREFAVSPEMQRLKAIGMNCGCEYTQLTHFRKIGAYSRFDHSYRVAQLIWHYTHSPEQALAGLFHDIATPVFAHVIDFLHGDYLTQQATEDGTASLILSSEVLNSLAERYGVDLSLTTDYHLYPVADNDSPALSADRLEYTFGNMVNYGFCSKELPAQLFQFIVAADDENGKTELQFTDRNAALCFTELSMKCSEVYICDEDRFSMQMLAELVGAAIRAGVLTGEDLYATEPLVIGKLQEDEACRKRWKDFCSYSSVCTGDEALSAPYYRRIDAKRRYINPLISGEGRVSAVFPGMRARMAEFVSRSLDYPVAGK